MVSKEKLKSIIESKIEIETDRYTEVKYSNNIWLHIQGHPNGKGSIEIDVILPHNKVDKSKVGRDCSTLSPDIDNVEQLYEDIESILSEITGKDHSDIVFQLMEVVDDGVWEQDASIFSTSEIVC